MEASLFLTSYIDLFREDPKYEAYLMRQTRLNRLKLNSSLVPVSSKSARMKTVVSARPRLMSQTRNTSLENSDQNVSIESYAV